MRNIAKNFLEYAQPVEQAAQFKDADESGSNPYTSFLQKQFSVLGELQIACPKVTKCQQMIE